MDDADYFDDGSYIDRRYSALDDFSDDIMTSSPSPAGRFAYQPLGEEDYVEEEVDVYAQQPVYHNEYPNHTQQFSDRVPFNSRNYQAQPQSASYQSAPFFPQLRPSHTQSRPQPSYPRQVEEAPVLESASRHSHGVRLVPVSDLPDIYRSLFKFGVFNAVQSTCFDHVVNENDNLVISAPTGSGKTVLFELSIIRMLTLAKDTNKPTKCVYMAPTKALCSERFKDWSAKFTPLGFKCCELTGDTVTYGQGVWGEAKDATIIITTGEKWDSLTRNWEHHKALFSQIRLFLVDEVHILNESRGSTLEVVVSRMKLRGSSVRFVLVSATVPNILDIASWIGSSKNDNQPAKVFQFGEEYRPCKLKRTVLGCPRGKNQNDFMFSKSLEFKLFGVLQKHSVGKPILVFCSTRKGTLSTAEQLQKEYKEAQEKGQSLPWSRPPRIDHSFQDKRLNELASFGIGVHHAGLSLDDRRATEELYLKKLLRVVVSTSTLAVGVNLPAHTVVIKGVFTFQNNTSVEYSDLDIMQMLGRAGRPQFDKEGLGIIMCESSLEAKYTALVQGHTVLESCLHTNLSEHLNSEIGLGTIDNISSAKAWLKKSFLFQRIKQNPNYYALGKNDNQTWEERVDDLVMQSVEKLKQTKLVEHRGDSARGDLGSTDFGDIMSKFYIRLTTASLIHVSCFRLADPLDEHDFSSSGAAQLAGYKMIASSEELSEIKLRTSEKTLLNTLRRHNDIRFEVKKVEKTSDKAFILIQAVLGGISLNAPEFKSGDSQLHFEAYTIFKHIVRIGKAITEVGLVKKWGAIIKHGLELVRCFQAKAWEDRPVVLRQIESIGEKSCLEGFMQRFLLTAAHYDQVLAERGIVSIEALRKADPLQLELLLNRRPPFGHELLAATCEFPNYFLKVKEVKVSSDGGKRPVQAHILVECGLLDELSKPIKGKKTSKYRPASTTVVLTLTSDQNLVDFRRIPTKLLKDAKNFELTVILEKPSQSVSVLLACEAVAGVGIVRNYKPNIPSHEFPTRDTRPQTAIERDLEGLEDIKDFWDYDIDDDVEVPVKDLTKTKPRNQSAKVSAPVSTSSKKTETLKTLDNQPTEPKKLPNGNYACNHNCKDKQKCRHMCCRDGLAEAPKSSKSRTATSSKPSNPPTQPSVILAYPVPKVKPSRSDRSMEQLEALHKRTHVKENLKLPEGQRIKLEPAPRKTLKRRPAPDFNIEFSDLHDANPQEPSSMQIDQILEDDDDFPESHALVNVVNKGTPAADTSFEPVSICDLTGRVIPASHATSSQDRYTSDLDNDFAPAPRPPKRARIEETFGDELEIRSSPTPMRHASTGPLFFDDEAELNHDNTDIDDDFAADSSYLTSPDLTVSSSSMNDVSMSENTSSVVTFQEQPVVQAHAPANKNTEDRTEEADEIDDYAEFEKWLNSGAVQVIR